MRKDFVLLANGTAFYVVCDSFLHSRPPVFFLRLLKGFIPAWVPCCGVIMHESHDTSFDFEDRGYDDFSFGFYDSRGRYEFFFWEHYDVLVVGFSLISAWRS